MVCTHAMTVRANDIALGDLGEQFRTTDSTSNARDLETLDRGIAVIKVHDVWREPSAAVGARNVSQRAEKSDVLLHRASPASEELLAIAQVVLPGVCGFWFGR